MNTETLKETGIINLRDIGGYEIADGRKVKKECFYRSAVISFHDDFQREAFEKLSMKAILDLRSPQERESAPDEHIPGCEYHPISAVDFQSAHQGNMDMSALAQKEDIEVLMTYMRQMYAQLPFHNPAYQKMFDLMKTQKTPFVFHCSAGKDRTGVAAYLILKTLGVDDSTIMKDYLLSNEYRREENERIFMQLKDDTIRPLMEVQSDYLQAAMDAIQNKYDTFEDFLYHEYAIDENTLNQLKDYYLE